jgi:hypothetical protein
MRVKIYVDSTFVQSCDHAELDSAIDELSFEFDFGDGMQCQWEPDETGRVFLETVETED